MEVECDDCAAVAVDVIGARDEKRKTEKKEFRELSVEEREGDSVAVAVVAVAVAVAVVVPHFHQWILFFSSFSHVVAVAVTVAFAFVAAFVVGVVATVVSR